MARKKQPDAFPAAGLVMPDEFWVVVDQGDLELAHAVKWIHAGEQCGLDCRMARERAKALSDTLAGFRRAFTRGGGA